MARWRECLDEQGAVDFAAGALPGAAQPEVERHLGTCDRCAELVAAAAQHIIRAPTAAQGLARSSAASGAGLSASRTRPLLPDGTRLDETYRIIRLIGSGAMGDVYEVDHARLAGRYAAKVLSLELAQNPEALSRSRREALIASTLSHPGIVQVIDFRHLGDGRPFLVMEYLNGSDLGQLLVAGPLSLERTLRLVRQIVAALAALHGARIIHRDLKPQNILVLADGDGEPERVKLVDFGLAKRTSHSLVVTHDRTLLGTPQYMAPEQALGNSDTVGPEADQFSLAALIYEMLSGQPAFAGDTLSSVLYRIVHEPPPSLAKLAPHLPVHLVAAIERGLAKRPEARFPSVKAFLRTLDALESEATSAPARGIAGPRPWVRRQRLATWVGVAALAAAATGALAIAKHQSGGKAAAATIPGVVTHQAMAPALALAEARPAVTVVPVGAPHAAAPPVAAAHHGRARPAPASHARPTAAPAARPVINGEAATATGATELPPEPASPSAPASAPELEPRLINKL
jgi:tRNA A-37 threonylcarbamoyl transferase component Bud32